MIGNYVSRIYNFIYDLVMKIFRRHKTNKITKNIVIEKITDERQINPLYNAVAWYLMNQVNLVKKEDYLMLFIISDFIMKRKAIL